jgi:hypothetical protein
LKQLETSMKRKADPETAESHTPSKKPLTIDNRQLRIVLPFQSTQPTSVSPSRRKGKQMSISPVKPGKRLDEPKSVEDHDQPIAPTAETNSTSRIRGNRLMYYGPR